MKSFAPVLFLLLAAMRVGAAEPPGFQISSAEDRVNVTGEALDVAIKTKGYCTGVAAGRLLDKKTGFRDQGYGLDIIDWLMEPGSDEAYRAQLPGDLAYVFNNVWHGKRAKKSVEGPQICTEAGAVARVFTQGADYLVVKQSWQYSIAARGKTPGPFGLIADDNAWHLTASVE